MSKNKNEIKKLAIRVLALVMAVLLVGGALVSSLMSMIHFH